MELRSHQQQAVNEALASIAFGSKKLILDLPTSFGKSLVLATLAKDLSGKVAIVVTFTPLIEQIGHHLELINEDYSILKAGMENRFDESKRIQLIMKQTYYARKDKLNLTVDYMLKDEVHVEWFGQKRMDEIFKALGEPALIGVSGTSYDSKGYKLRGSDDLIRVKSIADLEKDGFLTPVKYYIPKWSEEIDYSKISSTGGDYTEKDIDEIVLQEEYSRNAIKTMLQMGIQNKKTIVFCNSIKHAETVSDDLRAKNVLAYAFHSKQDKKHSEAILESFKSNSKIVIEEPTLTNDGQSIECKVLVSVNKVSIGFDSPDIQLGVMMRKTAVRSLAAQQIGRLIRIYPGKEYAELLDIANNTAEFGFHNEVYNPVDYGKKEELRAENNRLSAPVIKLISKEEPTIITRELVLDKLKELKQNSKKISQLPIHDVIAIFETTSDIYKVAEIAYEMNRRKIGKIYIKASIDWVIEDWEVIINEYPQYKSRLLKTMKTRAKNIISQGKKLTSLHYFPAWLRKQTPYSNYLETDNTEPTDEVVNNYNAFDHIEDQDIPF